jgi:hypothetical protein
MENRMKVLLKTALGIAAGTMFLTQSVSGQSADIPRPEQGVPDLQGTYTYRTLTPLNRPVELADKETLTEEEAQEWQAYENRRQNRDLIIDSVGGAGYPPGVISYNEFWYERGKETTHPMAECRLPMIPDKCELGGVVKSEG